MPLGLRATDLVLNVGANRMHEMMTVEEWESDGSRGWTKKVKVDVRPYRLAYDLRNVSQHRSDVLHVSFGKRIAEVARVEAAVSDRVLDDAIADTKWQAQVREELKTHPRPIDAANLLRVLRGCLQRIYFRTLLAQRTDIESAIRIVQELAERVECSGELALVAAGPPEPEIPAAKLTLKIEHLELEAARVLETALPEGERLVWPRFAIQVSPEWQEPPATDALIGALADDKTVDLAVLSVVDAGTFACVTAASAYAARSAVARAIARSSVLVVDQRTGPALPLP